VTKATQKTEVGEPIHLSLVEARLNKMDTSISE
jgi:hypothetical protein